MRSRTPRALLRRAALLVLAAVSLASAGARADVTVIYAPAAPPPLRVVPVEPPPPPPAASRRERGDRRAASDAVAPRDDGVGPAAREPGERARETIVPRTTSLDVDAAPDGGAPATDRADRRARVRETISPDVDAATAPPDRGARATDADAPVDRGARERETIALDVDAPRAPAATPLDRRDADAPADRGAPAREIDRVAADRAREPTPSRDVAEPAPAAAPSEPSVPRPVHVIRALPDEPREHGRLALVAPDGSPDDESARELAMLARAPGMRRPHAAVAAAYRHDAQRVAPGIRRLHPGLLERLRALADRFPGHAIEIVHGVVSDAAPSSRHHHGLALDVRVVGASLDAVIAVLRRFPRTGVGVHRGGGFVHIDVRARSSHWSVGSELAPATPPDRADDELRDALEAIDAIRLDDAFAPLR